ncbi:MAG: thioredoxin family protein [Candidatus Melainabacteria bacterium]|nr:thioredoxin family protein [Candidatus Melainabacteria bacterium]
MKYFLALCLLASLIGCNSPSTSKTQAPAPAANLISEKKPSVIMFYANWCGYCKKMFPVFKELQAKYNNDINFFYIDIDTKRGGQLARQYRTKKGGVPDTQFYNAEGELLGERLGAIKPQELTQLVVSLIPKK